MSSFGTVMKQSILSMKIEEINKESILGDLNLQSLKSMDLRVVAKSLNQFSKQENLPLNRSISQANINYLSNVFVKKGSGSKKFTTPNSRAGKKSLANQSTE